MRFGRAALAVGILLFTIPAWSKQPPQNASTTQPASDPQSVAVVQAAITALGGATAISQVRSWTFQAEMQGSHANGSVQYVISTDADTGFYLLSNGTTRSARAIHSHFVPSLVGAILLKESQDPNFSMHFVGLSTWDSKAITIIAFTFGKTQFAAQIWFFDAANLPMRIDFRLPAGIGARESFPIVVDLSNYQPVSGVLYPFQIVSALTGKPAEIVTLQSVSTSATATPNDYNGAGGDLR